MNNGKKITNGKPSDRNLTIYERALIRREPYADIAQDHGLSIGRISQIVREVSTALVPEHLDQSCLGSNRGRPGIFENITLGFLFLRVILGWHCSAARTLGGSRAFVLARRALSGIAGGPGTGRTRQRERNQEQGRTHRGFLCERRIH